jgi:hypothetical protein
MSKQPAEIGPAPLARGARVIVRELGIAAWQGTVRAVKPSSVSGWWAEIERDDGSGYWSIMLGSTQVEEIAPEAPELAPDALLEAEYEGRFEEAEG